MAFNPNAPAKTDNVFTDLDSIRANFNALRNCEAAASQPANAVSGMFWLDISSTPYVMKQRNQANTAWLTLWNMNNLPMLMPASVERGDIFIYGASGVEGKHHGNLNDLLVSGGDGADPSFVSIATLLAGAIGQSFIKTSTGEVGGHAAPAYSANLTLPGGTYGFYPQIKHYGGPNNVKAQIQIGAVSATYVTNIFLEALHDTEDVGMYAIQRYITASGKEHWIFAVVEKATGKIISAYSAPDHPSVNNGGDPGAVPHPFPDYYKGVPEGLEIVLLDLDDTMKIKDRGLSRIVTEIRIDIEKEKAKTKFKPRDMDGKNKLTEKPACYKLGKIRK